MSLYDFEVLDQKGNKVSLKQYEGKALLIVNTATGCGFTPHYKDLEAIYEKYHELGFEILDFPCNQFKGQAPGTDEEIHEFCTLKYNTKFPQFKKIEVNGPNKDPLFDYVENILPYTSKGLKMGMLQKLSGAQGNEIRWNFTKFLFDKNGNPIKRYEPFYKMKNIDKEIEELLKK